MQQRLPSLLETPITFAHRGARSIAPENTIEAFQRALELGAAGLESDVWLTSDGIAVLDHDGEIGRFRKSKIAALRRDQLPPEIPALSDLIDTCGSEFHLSLDLKGDDTGQAVVAVIAERAPDLLQRTWLCHYDFDLLSRLRPEAPDVRLVNSTRLSRLAEGPERRAARLTESGIDGINLRRDDWNGGLVTLFHRFQRTAFAWDLQHEHELRAALRMGVDAVYSDYVDRMMLAYFDEVGE